MKCNSYMPNGNVKAECPLAEVARAIICDADVSFTGLTDVYNLATWKHKIQEDLDIYVPTGLTSYEVTTDDPNVLTTAFGQKFVTNEPAPSAVIYLNSNWCDYNDILNALQGGFFGIIYELKNGQLFLKRNADGTYKPFKARLTAINKGIPLAGDIANNFPVHIHHSSYDEFRKGALISPLFDLEELSLAMPVGLTMFTTSTMSSGSVYVQINERCGDGYAGLLVADFEVVDSNYLTSPAVTVVGDDTLGVYELTIQKNVSPANLAAGDTVVVRVKKLSGAVVTYLSNRVTLYGTGV